MAHTFASLARSDKRALDRVMEAGRPPAIGEVSGYEFRGWNVNAVTRVIGTRKFKKGVFGEPGSDHAWGYNVKVKQNAFEEPWQSHPSDADPERYAYFKVFTAAAARRPIYSNSLVIDYHASREYFALDPVGYTVDYLVYANETDDDLILGKSYWENGALRPFMGYFILERIPEPSNYERTTHVLSAQELRTVRAFAEAFIEGENPILSPDQIAWNVDRYLSRVSSSRIASLRAILWFIEHLLPRRHGLPFRKPFSKMPLAERRAFIRQGVADPKNRGLLRDLARVRALFVAGYYSDQRTHERVRFRKVHERPGRDASKLRVLERPAARVQLHEPAATEIACDVCVIGSGAAGAVVAYNAAAQGRDVVLLEEGPYVTPERLTDDEAAMTALLYKEGGLQSTVDLDMVILQGKALGGTTVINNAICFRLGDARLSPGQRDVLGDWQRLGASIDPDLLEAAFDRVEQAIDVRPLLQSQDAAVPPIDGRNARLLLDGWQAVQENDAALADMMAGLFQKNYHRCLGCGYCNWGCRFNRKMSALETYIPLAQRQATPARVIAECHAVGIDAKGGTARVRCERPDGRSLVVNAAKVVVSCGAIGSSVLLMKSGLGRNVGERFSFNAGTPVFARFPDRVAAFDGVQMAAYVDHRDFLLETLFYPPLAFAAALPGWFGTHFQRMSDYDHFACMGVLIGTEPNGRVKTNASLRRMFGPVKYTMKGTDLARMRRGIARAAQVFFAAGADTVLPATFADVVLDRARFGSASLEQIETELARHIGSPEDLTLSSAHPQGGNPMSDDAGTGVVNSRFRVHGTDNVYVCDASVFPTSIHINPQLMIMAMADYFARLGEL